MPNIFLGALKMYVLVRIKEVLTVRNIIDEWRQSEAIGTPPQARREREKSRKTNVRDTGECSLFFKLWSGDYLHRGHSG